MIWRKMGIFAITGNEDESTGWAIDSLECPSFKIGVGASRFGFVQAIGSSLTLRGQQLFDLVCKHDIVVLQHWPPRAFAEYLLKNGVKQILLWTDYECIPAAGYWSPLQRNVYATLCLFRAIGLTKNRFDEMYIDPYEASPGSSTDKPHCHYVNLWTTAKSAGTSGKATQPPDAFVQAVANQFSVTYRGLAVGIFIDNCMERPYFGTASNAPNLQMIDITNYQKSFTDMLNNLRKMCIGPVWGNCAASIGIYFQLDGKFDERVFVPASVTPHVAAGNSMASVDVGEQLRRGLHQDYAFHTDTFGSAVKWAIQEAPWKALKTEVSGSPPLAHDPSVPGVYDDNMLVVTARSGQWILHPGEAICG